MDRRFKEEIIQNDEKIWKTFKSILAKYDYEPSCVFGIDIQKNKREFKDVKFAYVTIDKLKAVVSTVSSHWTVDEAVIFSKQLQESIELASELNMYFKSLERIFEEEWKEYQKEIGNN